MTYYVQKKLPLGPIRFGVSTRRVLEAIDNDPALSTGANGEFLHRREDGFFFGDTIPVDQPVLPHARRISQTAFVSSLMPDGTPRGYGLLALIVLGVLFNLLGIGVVTRKGPQGWLEVLIGLICIAIPTVMTAQRRRQLREQEEHERAEREALEARNVELLTWYTKALNHLHTDRGRAALDALRLEHETLVVPYEIWSPSARRTILEIGFDELARRGVVESKTIAALLRDAGEAAGLTPEDITGLRHDLYATVCWHFLADDRLGTVQEQELNVLSMSLGYTDDDLRAEALAAAQFRDLRGVTSATLPRAQSPIQLGFQEYCIHLAPLDAGTLVITNRLLIVDDKKRVEVLLPKVFDVVVDVDDSVVTVKTDQKKPLRLRLGYPIFTAAMIDLAAGLDERPKGFA